MEYRSSPGEGTFYGPKIDLHMTDVLGRSWQMGTIQLDCQMPARFGLTYMGPDNREHSPVVIHRALFGSLERFIGILVEHYGGDFPFWLAPVQVRVVPVGEGHREAAAALRARLVDEGLRVEVDERDETLGKRIRDAELEKVPVRRRLGRPRVRRGARRARAGRRPVDAGRSPSSLAEPATVRRRSLDRLLQSDDPRARLLRSAPASRGERSSPPGT